jgi:hypothetical protein
MVKPKGELEKKYHNQNAKDIDWEDITRIEGNLYRGFW